MSHIKFLPSDSIQVENRARQLMEPTALNELKASIAETGLINPVTIDADGTLLAGERRYRAMCALHAEGVTFTCMGVDVPPGTIPCHTFNDKRSTLEAALIEYHENFARRGFTPLEEARMIKVIAELRYADRGEFNAITNPTGVTRKEIAAEAYSDMAIGTAQKRVRDALTIEAFKDHPEVQKADSFRAAAAIAKKLEERSLTEAMNSDQGAFTRMREHLLYQGDYRTYLDKLDPVPVIITDPPYGINAQDAAGNRDNFLHREFDDTPDSWRALMQDFISRDLERLTLSNAYVMLFCAFERFHELAAMFPSSFIVRKRPVIWYKGHMGAGSAKGYTFPRNNYDCILLARRGDRMLREMVNDVIHQYPSVQVDKREQHPDAKPVELLKYLIRVTCFPGDRILDPFVGSGQIYLAASPMAVDVTGVELHEPYYHVAISNMIKATQSTSID